jgi:hypothetical protein
VKHGYTLIQGSGFQVVQLDEEMDNTSSFSFTESIHFDGKSLVLARQYKNSPSNEKDFWKNKRQDDPVVLSLLEEVNYTRWFSNLQTLSSYNRYTTNEGNVLAREWIRDQFESFSDELQVEYQYFQVSGEQTANVVATLPGILDPPQYIIIGAHFDSTSQSTSTSAPGLSFFSSLLSLLPSSHNTLFSIFFFFHFNCPNKFVSLFFFF